MTPEVEKIFDEIDTELAGLIEELKSESPETLNRAPQPGKWSVVQVMSHLMRAESLSDQYLRKKLSFNPKLKDAGWNAGFREWLLWFYLSVPIKFPAPKLVSTEYLPESADFEELAEKWQSQRAALRSFMAELPSDIFRKEVYKHPISGRLSLGGMLKFYKWHFVRHRKQIRRALNGK